MRTAALLLCALLAGPALAQPAAPNPDALTPDGARYHGPLRNGKLHGRGKTRPGPTARSTKAASQTGLYRARGKVRWANGQAYEGEFRDGMMDGRGRMTTPDGAVYEGEFKRSHFSGHGEIVYPDGRKYRGDFMLGNFRAKGRLREPGRRALRGRVPQLAHPRQGPLTDPAAMSRKAPSSTASSTARERSRAARQSYSGDFKHWRFDGQGELRLSNGDVYRGGFDNGLYGGQGTLTYAKPVPTARRRRPASGVRHARAEQRESAGSRPTSRPRSTTSARCSTSDRALAPRDPGEINLYLLAVAGDGSQEVFRREVEFVQTSSPAASAPRNAPSPWLTAATPSPPCRWRLSTSIGEALNAIAARMDREKDILFIFLSSHGSKDHELSLDQNGMDLPDLSANELAAMLRESGIRWKVIVVSACYAGGFIRPDQGRRHPHHHGRARRPPLVRLCRRQRFHLLRRGLLQGRAAAGPSPSRTPSAPPRASCAKWSRRPPAQPAAGRQAAQTPSIRCRRCTAPRPIERQLQRWWSQRK